LNPWIKRTENKALAEFEPTYLVTPTCLILIQMASQYILFLSVILLSDVAFLLHGLTR
jgi:hypothetical protein